MRHPESLLQVEAPLPNRLVAIPQVSVESTKRLRETARVQEPVLVDVQLHEPDHGHGKGTHPPAQIPRIQAQKRLEQNMGSGNDNRWLAGLEDTRSATWSPRWENSLVGRKDKGRGQLDVARRRERPVQGWQEPQRLGLQIETYYYVGILDMEMA